MDLVTAVFSIALLLGAIWLGSAFLALFVARARGGNLLPWIAYSFLLGPVALALVLRLAHPCPKCQAKVLRGVRVCPACQHPIPPLRPEDNPVGSFWSYRRNW